MSRYRGLVIGSSSREFIYGDVYREVEAGIELLDILDGVYKVVNEDTFRESIGVEDRKGRLVYDGDVIDLFHDGVVDRGFVTFDDSLQDWVLCVDDFEYVPMFGSGMNESLVLGHLWDGKRYD